MGIWSRKRPFGSALTAVGACALVVLVAGGVYPLGAQGAPPPLLRQFCEGHGPPNTSSAGECVIPRGIAVNQASGDAFVANQDNRRIERFTAWGEMLRAWGWDVVKTGPDNDVTAPSDEFEVCVPANGDVCKQGLIGESAGEFGVFGPQGIAVDSAGDVYVVDTSNRRVQKFDPEGNFLLMFGGDVNKTKVEAVAPEAERNICPVDPGDVCQAGSEGTGSGQFGAWAVGSYIAIDQSPPDTIYVGDQERIQKFDTNGAYVGQLALPEAGTVQSLAFDSKDGNLYFAYQSPVVVFPNPGAGAAEQPDVHRLSPSTGEEIGEPLEVPIPTAVTADSEGNVYVFEAEHITSSPELQSHAEVFKFNATGKLAERFGKDEFTVSTGIATSAACGIPGQDLFAANSDTSNSFIRLYGPPPDINLCPPPKVSPTIKAQHALSVGTKDALVRAQINPHFWSDTRYYVEYGTGKCSEGECDKTALFPGAQLGVGVADAFFTTKGVFLGAEEPLLPDTTYHYRFVSESDLSGAGTAVGEGEAEAEGTFHTFPLPSNAKVCPNQTFRTGASSRLPDCRAYELVTPLDKNNSDVSKAFEAHDLSSLSGDAFTYATLAAAYGDPVGAPFAHQYMSSRDPEAGWQTRSISAPKRVPLLYSVSEVPFNGSEFKAFSEDLCSGWMLQDADIALAPAAPEGVPNLYRRDNCDPGEGEYDLVTPVFPPGYGKEVQKLESTYYPSFQGSSADESIAVFRANAKLTNDAKEEKGLYQLYALYEGQLHLVSMRPNGKEAASSDSSAGSRQGAGGVVFKQDSVQHAVSEDGSRIFWSERKAGGDALYVRVNPLAPQSEVKLGKCTEPEKACTLSIAEGGAHFHTAAADGSVAIYQVGGQLFEYDVDKAASTSIATGVDGVMGASKDATRIYFVSSKDLDGAGGGVEGEPNLYLYEKGVAGLRFIATLAQFDAVAVGGAIPSSISNPPDRRTSRVSPDGLHLAFTSTASLTGYDNTDANSEQADAEVFVYDAGADGGAGELVCASCNPSGGRPVGRQIAAAAGKVVLWAAASLPGWIDQFYPGRFLADDGDRLFFQSYEALVTRDTNGKQDVYEWERAAGKEDCTDRIGGELFVEASGGCLSLISSGESKEDAELVDASAGGRDVFFATESSLLPQDYGLRDVYDARELGGFPAPQQTPPGCEGEACQGAAATPEDPTPASSAYQGPENLGEDGSKPRCPKGKRQVRRAGKTRCVKKQKHAHKRTHGRKQGGAAR